MEVLRVALDATSLLGARTGVGRFTEAVGGRLDTRPDIDLTPFAVTWRSRHRLAAGRPADHVLHGRPVPARLARALWSRANVPPVEWLAGRCDVVHGPNFVVPPARHAAEVLTVHDLTTLHFPDLCTADTLAYPHLIERAVARGAWVHTVSRFVAGEVCAAFSVDPDRVVAIANGCDAPLPEGPSTDAAAGRRLAGGPRYVLALGTVEPRKNLPLLVEAFDAVAAIDPGLRLVIAGPDGWGAEVLASAWERAHHRRRIRRLGWVSDEQRAALLRGATVFVYPSRYEGFGLPPLEAMAVGTPVVATTAGALPEVLGDAALLITPDDRDALGAALVDVLADDTLRAELAHQGLLRVSRYDWDQCTDDLVALYRRAHDGLGRPGTAR